MREISEIIIHCSATKAGQDFRAKDIDIWHRARGWRKIGYHYVIDLDGTIEEGRKEHEIGAHCRDHNAQSIGICYVGGLNWLGMPADTRTNRQKHSLWKLITELKERYPNATVHGHNEFARKACPCFNVKEWLLELSK